MRFSPVPGTATIQLASGPETFQREDSMQYVISLSPEAPNAERFARLVQADDASAVMDHPSQTHTLRLSTCLSMSELHALASAAQMPVGIDAIKLLPSVCCGGCSG